MVCCTVCVCVYVEWRQVCVPKYFPERKQSGRNPADFLARHFWANVFIPRQHFVSSFVFLFFRFQIKKTLCVCFVCVCVCESACVYVSVVMYTRPQSLGIPWLTFSVSRSRSISLSLSDDLKKNKTWVIISSTGSDTHHLSFSLSPHSLIIAMLIHQSSSNSTERRFSFYYLNGLNSSWKVAGDSNFDIVLTLRAPPSQTRNVVLYYKLNSCLIIGLFYFEMCFFFCDFSMWRILLVFSCFLQNIRRRWRHIPNFSISLFYLVRWRVPTVCLFFLNFSFVFFFFRGGKQQKNKMKTFSVGPSSSLPRPKTSPCNIRWWCISSNSIEKKQTKRIIFFPPPPIFLFYN